MPKLAKAFTGGAPAFVLDASDNPSSSSGYGLTVSNIESKRKLVLRPTCHKDLVPSPLMGHLIGSQSSMVCNETLADLDPQGPIPKLQIDRTGRLLTPARRDGGGEEDEALLLHPLETQGQARHASRRLLRRRRGPRPRPAVRHRVRSLGNPHPSARRARRHCAPSRLRKPSPAAAAPAAPVVIAPLPNTRKLAEAPAFVLGASDSPSSSAAYGLTVRNTDSKRKLDPQDDAAREQPSPPGPSGEDLMLRRFKEDMAVLPEIEGTDEYDEVPVEGFGAALLAGYGWKEGDSIGKKYKGMGAVKVREYGRRRCGTQGLGS
ncbi:uncharacterized protein LOC119292784 [Triticum dicoccoides]|uniref:uncharacterized protein LOC119292784 n=1 Tax=Triticum dicoccoides TaxID=85692 RepID=UPI0018907DC0|nr:uncharacterized protein LOC119292784 [Triticum dicoccoides]